MASDATEPFLADSFWAFSASVNFLLACALSKNWNKAHARRDYADAIKAAAKDDPETVKNSVAYQALARIGTIYKIEKPLRDLAPEERLKERQLTIGPLVDEYFTWIKKIRESGTVLPKGKASDGINYSINQEKYLRVFLTNGKVPIDNSASKRSIRTFCIGKKNWVFINSIKGVKASAAASMGG